jgi:hypothetical protein
MIRILILLSLILCGCTVEGPADPSTCAAAKRGAVVNLPSGHYHTFEGGGPKCPYDSFDLVILKDSARVYTNPKNYPAGDRYYFTGAAWVHYTFDPSTQWFIVRAASLGPADQNTFDAQIQVFDSTEYSLLYGSCSYALRKSRILPDSSEVWPPPPSTGILPPKPKPSKGCPE